MDSKSVFLSIYLVHTLLDVFLCVLLFRFHRSYQHRYLRHWGLSWAALGVFHALGGVSYWLSSTFDPTTVVRIAMSSLYLTAGYLQVWWLLQGTFEVHADRSPRWRVRPWGVVAVVGFSVVTVGLTAGAPIPLMILARLGPYQLMSGLAFLVTAIIVYRTVWSQELGRSLFAFAMGVYALTRLSSFLAGMAYQFEALGVFALSTETYVMLDLVDIFVNAALGVAVVVWLLEDERSRTERAEAKSRQTQRLEAVGRLAGGIAHDFNNLLTVILGYCSVLQADPSRGSDKPTLEMQRAAETAARLTQQLLAFSRKQVMQMRVISLNDVVRETEELLRRLIPESIELDISLEDELPPIEADPAQIQQVLMNLTLNARDAIPGGGTITIQTLGASGLAGEDWRGPTFADGPSAVLSIRDSGVGMDQETREKLFEPFFTTKPLGKGTGLGLATVYGIVRQSRGAIRVRSELGAGSVFEVGFPTVDRPLSRPVETETKDGAGQERVLLVEDDSGVRAYVAEALRRKGYGVFEAESPQQAIDLVERRHEPLDLLLTDVVMPQMNGKELAERLKSNHPDLSVLYISGYVDDEIRELDGPLLQKPFGSEVLLTQVRDALAVKSVASKH